ncbi:hypothetical protein DVB69_06590 [Sporosarcina sp. BI001-red]|uniref:asparaginase n=1 Tax=Sporosarcina sp. BI001-red TaxID=2282866 RepID=UPI000E260827|nr:asparaginase [Sporosarcina sp. BI001-red]REB08785.1 hypothetical protein DVB69_06590 [Sporosarcina sp. BI001-red]
MRGENVESGHTGHIAVVDSNGKLVYSCGNPYRHTFARSSMKPLQIIPIIEAIVSEKHKFAIGVQWHPENTACAGDVPSKKLFDAFIKACN